MPCQGVTFGNGRFIAVGAAGIAHSFNAMDWSIVNTMGYFMSVTYGNGRFVVVGSHGRMAHSTNGINWTQITVGTNHWTSVTYGNGRFVAVGSHGRMAHSTNGINWTQITVGSRSWFSVTSRD